MARTASLILLILLGLLSLVLADNKGRGWNDKIDWKGFDDGLAAAKETGKPMMVVIHKTWCGACKRLKPEFADSSEIEQLSSKFVMVNLEDDEEPDDSAGFAPDGGYIPRILFADSNGKVRDDIYNPTRSDGKYKYFYSTSEEVVDGMNRAAQALGAPSA
eukprot:TRINITY_DN7349_c0_g1_i1.p1 TRINITY_DN7349_c0_g1~~TRINITY_DN7349_c0_g1_i1.p1  ORF type:complete len:160 (+),score=34.58 TRINITY_DN7349_c0_g1_i1:88-567(+)